MAQSISRHPPWEDLQQELLFTIANFLITNPNPNFLDIHSFRSVCNSWRSSFPPFSPPSILSPILPIITILPPSSLRSRHYNSHHRFKRAVLSITIVYSLRPKIIQSELTPPTSFLLFVDEFECVKLRIRQAFSENPCSLPIYFPAKVNLIDFNAREIGRFCNLSYCYYYRKEGVKVSKRKSLLNDVVKVILLGDGSAAIALFDEGALGLIRLDLGFNFVGLCRKSDLKWDVLHDGKNIRFDDIVEYKGRVLAVDRGCRVYEIDCLSFQINIITTSTYLARGSGRRKRLVESLGVLHLVVRCTVGVTFKVYELNFKEKKWVRVYSIGDRVFFFGHEFSFSASAEEVSCRINSFLFRQRSFWPYDGYVTEDSKVFCHLGDGSVDIRVYHLDSAACVGTAKLYSGSSENFWPPPAWIWPVNRSARLETVDAAIDGMYTKHFENFKIKYPDLTVERADLSYDDFQQLGNPMAEIVKHDKGVAALKRLLSLKKRLNRTRKTEQTLVNWEKIVHDALPINGNDVSVAVLNQMVEAVVLARTTMTDKGHNSFDDIQKHSTIDFGFLQKEMSTLYVEQNAVIFQIEKSASKLVSFYGAIHEGFSEL